MEPDVLVIVPSRGRPERAAEMTEAFEATSVRSKLLVLLDDNDSKAPVYRVAARDRGVTDETKIMWWIARQNGFAPRLSHAALAASTTGEYRAVVSWGDDHIPRTVGWDQKLLEALDVHSAKAGSGFAYPDDTIQEGRLPTACLVTCDVVRAMGYLTPPGLGHLYVDDVWLTIGKALGIIKYVPEVIIEHKHWLKDGVLMDETYQNGTSDTVWADDGRAWDEFRESGEMALAIKRIARDLGLPDCD